MNIARDFLVVALQCLDREFGVGCELLEQLHRSVEFAKAGYRQLLELALTHSRRDGTQFPLHSFESINRLV
jgi:hypothetical protein